MGVKRLWDLLSPFGTPSSPSDWRGKRIAIDASIWIEQFRRAAPVTATTSDECQIVLEGFLRRLLRLIYFGVLPVIVFDGPAPAIKRQEQFRRAAAQDEISARARQRRLEHVIVQRLIRGEIAMPGRDPNAPLPTVEEATAMVHAAAQRASANDADTPQYRDLASVFRAVQRPPSTPIKVRRPTMAARMRAADSTDVTPIKAPDGKRHRSETELEDGGGVLHRNSDDANRLAAVASKRNANLLRRLSRMKEMDDAAETISRQNLLRSASSFLGPFSAISDELVAAAAGVVDNEPRRRASDRQPSAAMAGPAAAVIGIADHEWEVERALHESAASLVQWAEVHRKSSSSLDSLKARTASKDITVVPSDSDNASSSSPSTATFADTTSTETCNDDDDDAVDSVDDDDALSSSDASSLSVRTIDITLVRSDDDDDDAAIMVDDGSSSVVVLPDGGGGWQPVNISRAPSITVIGDRDNSSSSTPAVVLASLSPSRSRPAAQRSTADAEGSWPAAFRGPQEVPPRSDGRDVPLHLVEVVELLDALGVPFVFSPSEADATCGFLSATGVVDAVMTEDSDVFLFGARSVLRGFFGNSSGGVAYSVQHVSSADLDAVGLTREVLIGVALLMGSDYTTGVTGMTLEHAIAVLFGFNESLPTHQSHDTNTTTRMLHVASATRRFAEALDCEPCRLTLAVAPLHDDESMAWVSARLGAVKRVLRGVYSRHGGLSEMEDLDARTAAIRRWALPNAGADTASSPFPSPRVVEAYLCPTVAARHAVAPWHPDALLTGNTSADWTQVRNAAALRCGWSQQELVTRVDAVRAQCMLRADKDAVADARCREAAGEGQRRIDSFVRRGGPIDLSAATVDAKAVLQRAAAFHSRATGVHRALELLSLATTRDECLES